MRSAQNTFRRLPSLHVCLSAVVPASQNRTSICCLRSLQDRQRRLSFCSLPVPKQSEGSLGRLLSVAQSATSRIWQPARRVILSFLPQAAVKPPGGCGLLNERNLVVRDRLRAARQPSSGPHDRGSVGITFLLL